MVIIADAILIQYILFWSLLSFTTRSGKIFFIFSTGNSSPITPVDAKIRSLIFTVSLVPLRVLDSFKVSSLDKFYARVSILSLPCFPVKVFAFFVFTSKAFIIFLWELLFQGMNSDVILLVVVKVA